jgi:hypothetical protein
MEDLGEIAATLIACQAAASFYCFVDAATTKGQEQIRDSLGRPACSLFGSSMLHRMLTKISKLGDDTAVGVRTVQGRENNNRPGLQLAPQILLLVVLE